METKKGQNQRSYSDNREPRGLDCGASQTPEGLNNYGDDHGLDAVQNGERYGQRTISNVGPRKDAHDQSRGGNETNARDEQPFPTCPQITNVNGQFAGTGAGNEIAGAEQIEKFLAGEPLATANQLVFHDGDVRRRAAEGGGSEPQKKQREFTQGMIGRGGTRRRNGWYGLRVHLGSHVVQQRLKQSPCACAGGTAFLRSSGYAAPLQNRRLAVSLEGELERELDQARVVDGGVDGTEAAGGIDVADRFSELSVVEEVEEFGAEVQVHVFPWQPKPLDDGEIGVDEVRAINGNTARVAQLACSRLHKAGRVDVLDLGLVGVGIAASHLIRAVEIVAVAAGGETVAVTDAGIVSAVDQRIGEPRGDFFDEGELPAAEKRVGQIVPTVAKSFAAAKRQIIDHASGEIIVQINLRGGPIEFLPIGEREEGGAHFGTHAVG